MWAYSAHRILVSVALDAWKRKTAFLLLLSLASLTGNFVTLSSFFEWDALSGYRSLYLDSILPFFNNNLPQVWRRPFLLVLLNIILLTIVMKSGTTTSAKGADLPQVFQTTIHRIASLKAFLHDFDVQRSSVSSPTKQEPTAGEKRRSLFTIEPLETDREAGSQYTSLYHEEQEKILSKTVTENTPPFFAVRDQEVTVFHQNATPAYCCGLVEDTLLTVESQVVLIKDRNVSGCPDEQSVLIVGVQDMDEGMSTEELNIKAEAYIQKVRKSWWLQRQASFNRLCGLVPGDGGSLL